MWAGAANVAIGLPGPNVCRTLSMISIDLHFDSALGLRSTDHPEREIEDTGAIVVSTFLVNRSSRVKQAKSRWRIEHRLQANDHVGARITAHVLLKGDGNCRGIDYNPVDFTNEPGSQSCTACEGANAEKIGFIWFGQFIVPQSQTIGSFSLA